MQARIIAIPESLLGRDTISAQGLPDDSRLRHSLRLGLIRIRRGAQRLIKVPATLRCADFLFASCQQPLSAPAYHQRSRACVLMR